MGTAGVLVAGATVVVDVIGLTVVVEIAVVVATEVVVDVADLVVGVVGTDAVVLAWVVDEVTPREQAIRIAAIPRLPIDTRMRRNIPACRAFLRECCFRSVLNRSSFILISFLLGHITYALNQIRPKTCPRR